jgi:hypothetical protein
MLHEAYDLVLWVLFSFVDAYESSEFNLMGTLDDKFFSTAQWILSMIAVGVVVSADSTVHKAQSLLTIVLDAICKGEAEEKQATVDAGKAASLFYTLYGRPIIDDHTEEYDTELSRVERSTHIRVWSVAGYSSVQIMVETQAYQTSIQIILPSDFQQRVTDYYLDRSNSIWMNYYAVDDPTEEHAAALDWNCGMLIDTCDKASKLVTTTTFVAYGSHTDDLAAHLCDCFEDTMDASERSMLYCKNTAPICEILESAQGAAQRALDTPGLLTFDNITEEYQAQAQAS